MISDIVGLNNTQPAVSNTSEQELGKDEFLKLLVTQMQNQDPLNPMDSTEYTAQLAQYTSLEQLYNIDETLGLINTGQQQDSSYNALEFIGKQISAQGHELSFEKGKSATGSFSLAEQADCSVMITDANGDLVREKSLGSMQPGTHTFDWDGQDDTGSMQDSGVYDFQVIAKDGKGQIRPVETRIAGEVTRVSLEGNSPVLYVGEIPVAMSQIMEISK